jgi:hypothetical protein
MIAAAPFRGPAGGHLVVWGVDGESLREECQCGLAVPEDVTGRSGRLW